MKKQRYQELDTPESHSAEFPATVIIRKWGDSHGITIPKQIVRALGVEAGSILVVKFSRKW